jgi:hypothetical protein
MVKLIDGMHKRYFNSEEEATKYLYRGAKSKKCMNITIVDREDPIFYPEEIEEDFGRHKERFMVRRYEKLAD